MEKHVYSSLKLFKYVDRMEAFKSRKVKAPVHVRIKPTNVCNHDCWFCAYRVSYLNLGEDMDVRDSIPEEKMQEIVKDLTEMGVEAVTFSGGGEPLIYKHIVPTVEALGQAGVKVATLTNGTFLKGDVARAFADHGTWVRISMDAWDDASLVKFRGAGKSEFTKILENIRNFIALDSRCVLGISFIITKDNSEHIYEFCSLMKDLGVDHVKLSACVVSIDGKENNKYHAEFKSTVKEELKKCMSLVDSDFQIVDRYHEASERFGKEYKTCPFLQFLVVIGADSKIYTCQDKAYTNSGLLGDINKHSFKEVWFSKENQDLIYSLDPSKTCSHHCVAHSKNLAIHEYIELDEDHGSFV